MSLLGRIGSIFAADGTLYAIRRSLYVPIGDPAQADDIAISTRVSSVLPPGASQAFPPIWATPIMLAGVASVAFQRVPTG